MTRGLDIFLTFQDGVASSALDLYREANGFREPPASSAYTPEFLDTYRRAQRARVERIDAEARRRQGEVNAIAAGTRGRD